MSTAEQHSDTISKPRKSRAKAREKEERAHLSALLRGARDAAGMSQAELERALAKVLGVEGLAPMTISRYERAERVPSWGTLAALLEVFTGRRSALVDALTAALKPAPPARKRKESP